MLIQLARLLEQPVIILELNNYRPSNYLLKLTFVDSKLCFVFDDFVNYKCINFYF